MTHRKAPYWSEVVRRIARKHGCVLTFECEDEIGIRIFDERARSRAQGMRDYVDMPTPSRLLAIIEHALTTGQKSKAKADAQIALAQLRDYDR